MANIMPNTPIKAVSKPNVKAPGVHVSSSPSVPADYAYNKSVADRAANKAIAAATRKR